MTGENSDSRFTAEEFDAFVDRAVRDAWTASRDAGDLHDVSIVHEENGREILIDSARNRVSYRDTDSDEWGIQQKPVTDITGAATKLQTVALSIPMNEMHYLGLNGHPDPPNK